MKNDKTNQCNIVGFVNAVCVLFNGRTFSSTSTSVSKFKVVVALFPHLVANAISCI